MKIIGRARRVRIRPWSLIALVVALAGCRAPDPLLSFLDNESSLSFTHPPRWSVGFAEQNGLRYRYLTAPKVENDAEALSVTLNAPVKADSADLAAQPYLTGATDVVRAPGAPGANEWSFRDSSGMSSRLRIKSAAGGLFFGAWARGSEAAMKHYSGRLDVVFASLSVETPADWPEELFGGMAVRVPPGWSQGSRLKNATNAMMQFKSLPLAVEKGADTIHGFITLSKEPVPAPGNLDALRRMLKDRGSDTVVVLEHRPWKPSGGAGEADGDADYLRSGTTLTATRSRRWITVKNHVGLIFACEARADAFDRLEPWCERMAGTVRLE
ncbi:MAG: hypothetical protein JJE39_05440 [Vicinamibacteria bacterium]|nr:hypothetical protein [Vicinamibacteria bacterium]